MSLNDKDKLNRIEELKSKLFNRSYKTRTRFHDIFSYPAKEDVADSWVDEEREGPSRKEKFFMKTSLFKKFFIFSMVFFVLALGYASYIFLGNNNTVSNDNIDIFIQSNAFTAGGEDYPLLLQIANRNSSPLLLADLVVEYPKGSNTDSYQDYEHLRLSLGTIPAGGVKNENIKVILFGEQGNSRQIKISLEYRVEGSNAIFVKDKDFDVSINSTPINISLDFPGEVTTNQDVNLGVKVTLNATKALPKVLLKIDYPIGFQFEGASIAPSLGNNIWSFGDLAPGTERDISIKGKMVDVFEGEKKVFHIYSGSQSASDKSMIDVVLNSVDGTLNIKKSSIEAKLFVNGIYQSEYAVDTKSPIQGQIQWKNNLETKVNNLRIYAKISGDIVDRNKIRALPGFYDSSQNLIIWDKDSQSNFAEVNPGDTGVVTFSISPLSLFSSLGDIFSAPSVKVDVSITGEQSQAGSGVTTLNNEESKIIKIISDVGLSNKALYYLGDFKNTGPIPPKVNQKTTYTIVWSLSNTANNISKAQVVSTVPSWIKLVGTISPSSEDVTYNETKREITWVIGGIPSGTGITKKDRSVSFQIEFTPSSSQVGTMPIIMNDTVLTGHDDFTNVDVRVNKASLSTRLLNDANVPENGAKVVE